MEWSCAWRRLFRKMYVHTFLFQWQAGVTSEMQERAAREIRGLREQIPGVLDASYGKNTSPRGQGFTHGGVMKFRDATALEEYCVHPAHQKLLEWMLPLLKMAADLDSGD